MPEIRYPALFIDAASKRTWAGLKLSADHLDSQSSQKDASLSLFRMISSLLKENNASVAKLKSLIVCYGPGSMLGIRTSIMGARAWEAVGLLNDCDYYVYDCLNVGAKLLANENPNDEASLIVTDARRHSWNALAMDGDGFPRSLKILENEALEAASGKVFTLSDFPIWTKTKVSFEECAYRPESVFDNEAGFDILKQVDSFDPLMLRESVYAKWSGSNHSAAPAKS